MARPSSAGPAKIMVGMGATADRAVRASLVTAAQLAEQARMLDEEAQLLRAENSVLLELREQLLVLLTAVNRTLGSAADLQRRGRSSAPPAGRARGADVAPPVDAVVAPDAERSAPLVLDRAHRRLVVGSNAITMSPREFDLLSHLLAHLGQPLAAEALARAVWPCPFEGDLRS